MIVYEVNITVDTKIADKYYTWLLDHVQQMLRMEQFLSAEVLQQTDQADAEKVTFTTIYKLHSDEDLQYYFTHHAKKMRAAGTAAFPNQFTASRRIFAVKETFNV